MIDNFLFRPLYTLYITGYFTDYLLFFLPFSAILGMKSYPYLNTGRVELRPSIHLRFWERRAL